MSTKTWQEELRQVVYNQEMKPEYRVLFQHRLEQLIMNIRKKDMEELIKLLPDSTDEIEEYYKQAVINFIKDYYENN